MSESKFTPGPYMCDGACVYKLSKDGVNVFSAQVASGYTDSGGRTSTDECEATARLLQSAPELLEAAQEVVAAWNIFIDSFSYQPGIGDKAEDMEFMQMMRLRAAINKATA